MDVIRENIDDVNIILRVNIEKTDYAEAFEKSLKDYRRKAVIPGFRPGKVPAGLIMKKFGNAILAEEVNKILSGSLSKFIMDEKLPLLGEPLPDEELQKPVDFEKDENFEFVYDIGLAPKADIILDKNSNYDYYIIRVDEEMIDRQVENIAGQYGTNVPEEEVHEKSNVRGNFIQLGQDGNEIAEGIRPEGVLVAVDLIKDESVKNEFIGKKQGDVLIFDPVRTFGSRHEVGHMLNISHEEADKLDGHFKFTISEINIYKPAEVNEELIKKAYGEDSGIKTIEEFRQKVKEEIANSLKQSSEYKFALDTHNSLIESIPLELPETFLKRWLMHRNKDFTEEQVNNEFGDFIKDLKWQIISDTIIKDNGLEVSDDEAMDFARRVALSQFRQYGMYNVTDEQLDSFAKMMLDKEEERDRLYRRLFEEKIMEVVKEKANIREKEVSNEEFSQMMK